jgi:cellobiose-specific phosphotransferase system component IIA
MEEAINTLIAISGKPRSACLQALQIAGGDPNIAFEVLNASP